MAITIEAVYENGVLKPSEPLPFEEHEKVSVTVEPAHIPIREQIIALKADIPPEEFDKLPPAAQPTSTITFMATRDRRSSCECRHACCSRTRSIGWPC